jgi:hypothetical protein
MSGPGRRCCAVLAAMGCAGLVIGGCAASRPPTPQAGPSGPVPRQQPAAAATALSRQAAAARYLTIAEAGNRRLEIDFDRLAGPDRRRLAAAQADLRDAAATEHLFDRRLLAITFPVAAEPVARILYQVNQSRARLTTAAAAAASLRQLSSFQQRLNAANGPVEDAVRVLRSQLGLRPPQTS